MMQHKDAFDMVPSGAPTTRGSAKQKGVSTPMPDPIALTFKAKVAKGRYCMGCLQFRPLGAFDPRSGKCRVCVGPPVKRARSIMGAQSMEGKK